MDKLIKILDEIKTDVVRNYVVAGLDSYLLNNGKVRLFECSRDHQDQLTPHSHRFDFACLVLSGYVTNRVWVECGEHQGDHFEESELTYSGTIGEHKVELVGRGWWRYEATTYSAGETYSMTADQVHSIQFSRGAKVLFFEGPEMTEKSLIIEPYVNGEKIPTYKKLDYMFKRDS